jgi:hypothetical protein
MVMLFALWFSGYAEVAAVEGAVKDCAISQPPLDSGEDGVHGTLLKVYPRTSQIDAVYSSCQTVWAREGEGWVVVMIGFFERGQVVRMRFPSKPGHPVEQCLKKDGLLIKGNRDVCSAMDAFPYSSALPGCLSDSVGRVASGSCSND